MARALAQGLCVGLFLLFAGPAQALPGGTIAVLKNRVESTPDFEKDVKKARTNKIEKSGDSWKLYFVAYLNKAAGSEEVNLVFYPAGGLKSGEHPDAFPIQTQAKAKILMSEVDISPVTGIKAGKYQIRLTRIIGGKEVIFAKGDVELLEPAAAAK